jgi:hypothetical protein
VQLTEKQVTLGCWYMVKDHLPPGTMNVIVTDGEGWAAAYVIGGNTWVWMTRPVKPIAWQAPSLPVSAVLNMER